ncbi:MAG: hypothetical protein K2X27_22585 [Candidatus Obscuribacterales bacterium]|nr:hypothetical protein [Candidatus Obscuribacterales bacterium]
MLSTQSSHYPSADDISFDSLEYLFAPAQPLGEKIIPWVEIEDLGESSESSTLPTAKQISALQADLEASATQIQKAYILIGYLQAIIQERNEDLKALADYRFRAAEAVALRLENERSKLKIQELEEQIARQEQKKETKEEASSGIPIIRGESQKEGRQMILLLALISLSLLSLSMILAKLIL